MTFQNLSHLVFLECVDLLLFYCLEVFGTSAESVVLNVVLGVLGGKSLVFVPEVVIDYSLVVLILNNEVN